MHSRHERRFGRQRMAFCESVFIYAEPAGHFALLACHEYATWLSVLNIGTLVVYKRQDFAILLIGLKAISRVSSCLLW